MTAPGARKTLLAVDNSSAGPGATPEPSGREDMVKIGVLGWDHGEVDIDAPVLREMGQARGHDTVLFTLEEIRYLPVGAGGLELELAGHPAASFDAVISRANLYGDDWQDRVERLTLLSNAPGVRVFDPAELWVVGYSKFATTQRLAAAGLPVPPTRSATTPEDIEAAWREWGDVIVKPSFMYGGTDVERITDPAKDADLVGALLARYGTLACMPYWPTEYGEYRLNVAGHRCCVAMLKLPPLGVWRCKTLEGATFERIDPPPELEELAFRAARVMGFTLAGIDALPTPDGYVILEVNPVPGILQMIGKDAQTEQHAAVYEWVEEQVAAG